MTYPELSEISRACARGRGLTLKEATHPPHPTLTASSSLGSDGSDGSLDFAIGKYTRARGLGCLWTTEGRLLFLSRRLLSPSRWLLYSSRRLLLAADYQSTTLRSLLPGNSQEKGDRSQESGDRSQETGVRRQETGVRRQELTKVAKGQRARKGQSLHGEEVTRW